MDDEIADQYVADLVDAGALSPSGVTRDGEFLYSMDPEKMKDVSPDGYDFIMSAVSNAIYRLLNDKQVDFVTEDPEQEPTWFLTERGKQYHLSLQEAVWNEVRREEGLL